MPLPSFPIPSSVPTLGAVTNQVVLPRPDGLPWIARIDVGRTNLFLRGRHVTIGVKGERRTLAGLYGPNPPAIDGRYGHLRSPEPKQSAGPLKTHFNGRNCPAGTYYVVIWEEQPDGSFGPLSASCLLTIQVGNWRIF